MGKTNRVVNNAAWIIGCKIVQSCLGLLVSMLTARYLGPSNFGLINYAASVVAFLAPIMQLGINSILVQELINNPDEEGSILGSALVMNLVSGFFCMIGVFAFSSIVNAGEIETIIVCALYSLQFLSQAMENIQYWFQSKLMSKYQSIVSVAAYILVAAYKIFLLVTGKSVRWFALSNAIDYLLISIALIVIYRKKGGQKYTFSKCKAKSLFNIGKYYIVSSMMVTIFAQTDKIMLKTMIGDAENGYYSAAVACAGLTGFVFSAVIDSMRPTIFEGKKVSQQDFEINLKRLYSVIIYAALIQSALYTLLAKPIIFVLYGKQYLPAVDVLRLITWYSTFAYIGSVRNIWILAEGKQHYLWVINLSGAVTNIILNALLIPYWGMMGAALASLITQIFTNVIVGYIIRPIRYNNKLMVQSLNPKQIKEMIGIILNRK